MDFQTRRQRFKRRLLRVIIPLGCVLLIVAAIMTITMVNYYHNRRDTLALSEDMLEALDRRIHSAVNAYLMPASNLVTIGAETTREHIDKIWSPSRTPVGIEVISPGVERRDRVDTRTRLNDPRAATGLKPPYLRGFSERGLLSLSGF